MRQRIGTFFLILLFVQLAGIGCKKQASDSDNVRSALYSEAASIRPGQPFWVGAFFKIKPGWHIYWKDPGDSGMATEVQWKLPDGFGSGPIHWPNPEKFQDSAGVTYGYKHEVLLMAEILPPANLKPGRKAKISARIRWLECREICVPGKADLTLTLPVQSGSASLNSDFTELFARSRSKISQPKQEVHP